MQDHFEVMKVEAHRFLGIEKVGKEICKRNVFFFSSTRVLLEDKGD